jgi:hypothetical protein
MGMDGHSGFRRLDRLTRAVESKFEPLAEFAAPLSHERAISRELGGRTIFDDREAPRKAKGPAQFRLFPISTSSVVISQMIATLQFAFVRTAIAFRCLAICR